MANTPDSLFNTDLFNNNLFNGNIDLSNPLDISKNLEGLPQIGITVTPPTKSSGATDLKTVISQNEALQDYLEDRDKDKRRKNGEKVDIQIEEKVNKALKNMSPWEGDRVQREYELRNEYTRLVTEHPEQKDALLQDLQVKLNAINEERELEKQGIRPNRPLNINPNDPLSPNFSNLEKKTFEATRSLKEKFDWTFPSVDTKRKEQLQGLKKGTITLTDADSGIIGGLLGDTPFRITSFNAQHQSNGMYDAIDSFETAALNPNKYPTQSVLVHRLLGKDMREAITQKEWEACHAYGLYLTAKYCNGELKGYEPFNLNKVDYYKDYFEKHKTFDAYYKDYGKDDYGRTLVDLVNGDNESLAVGLTFNPLINASFSVDKASDYIEASHRMSEALYAQQEKYILEEKKKLQDAKDEDGWIGEKWDMFKMRGAQVIGSLFAMTDFTERFMSEYVLGKGAGAWREYITNQDKLNYTFGIKDSTWKAYQADMERASEEFAKGNYLAAAALYGSNVANLIILSGPDMLATIGLTAALGPVGAYFGLTGSTARALLGLYARSFMAGSLISGTAQTVADMHEFEVKHGRSMNMQELARTWTMNGIGMSLEGILGGGMLARLLPGVKPYLIASPRRVAIRSLQMAGVNLVEEAGTEAIQEYIQNSISAANVRGGDYLSSLMSELSDFSTHGAEALAGAITGGAMSGMTQVTVLKDIHKFNMDNKKTFEDLNNYSAGDFDFETEKLNEKATPFTPEQLDQSHKLVEDLDLYRTSIFSKIQDGTLVQNDDFNGTLQNIFDYVNKSIIRQQGQFTVNDYLAAQTITKSLQLEVFKHLSSQVFQRAAQTRSSAELESFIDKTAELLSGKDKDIMKLSIKDKMLFIKEMLQVEGLGSGIGSNKFMQDYIAYVRYLYETNPKKYPMPKIRTLGNVEVLEDNYLAVKDILQTFERYAQNNPNYVISDADMAKSYGEVRKHTEDVHKDFLWNSEWGHSIYQLRRDSQAINKNYNEVIDTLEQYLAAKGGFTVTVNNATTVANAKQLVDAIKNDNKDFVNALNSSNDETLKSSVTVATNLSRQWERTYIRIQRLCIQHIEKYTKFGDFLESKAGSTEDNYVYSWDLTNSKHSFRVYPKEVVDDNSKTRKVFKYMQEECEAALQALEDTGIEIFGDNLLQTNPALYQEIQNYRDSLNVANAKFDAYINDAKMIAAGLEPTSSKVVKSAKYPLKTILPFILSNTYTVANNYLLPILYEYGKAHGMVGKAKKASELTDKQVAKLRDQVLNLQQGDKRLQEKYGPSNVITLEEWRNKFYKLKNLKERLSFAKETDLGNAIIELYSSKNIQTAFSKDPLNTIEYLKNNQVEPRKLKKFDPQPELSIDVRVMWLNMKESDRKKVYQSIEYFLEKTRPIINDVADQNIEQQQRKVFPTKFAVYNALWNIKEVIDNDAWLKQYTDPNNKFAIRNWNPDYAVNSYGLEDTVDQVLSKMFPSARVTQQDEVAIKAATKYFNYMAKNDTTGQYHLVEINGTKYFYISDTEWNRLITNPQVKMKWENPHNANPMSSVSMLNGVMNLFSIADTDRYVFSITEDTNPGKAADIVYADIAANADLQTNNTDYLFLNKDNKLSIKNENLKVNIKRADGQVFRVSVVDAVRLSRKLDSGEDLIKILDKLDVNDDSWEYKLNKELSDREKGHSAISYTFNGTTFTKEECDAHKGLPIFDFIYLQALQDNNIDIVQEVGTHKYVCSTANYNIYYEAEVVARALALKKAGKTGTKQELLDSYGVADEKYGPVGSDDMLKNYNIVNGENITLDMECVADRPDLFIKYSSNGMKASLQETLMRKLQDYFLSGAHRTYRGLNYENMQLLVDLMSAEDIAKFYFKLNEISGLTPLDNYLITHNITTMSDAFFTVYDGNIDAILNNIPEFAELAEKYNFGSTNQKYMDFVNKHDINLLHHTYEHDSSTPLEPMLKAMKDDTEAVNQKVYKTLEVLTGKNFKSKEDDKVDYDYELYIKGYYWLQLQLLYHEGVVEQKVVEALQKYNVTKQQQYVSITTSDGVQHRVDNPIGYMEKSIPFSHGMDVEDLRKAGYTVEIIEQRVNHNAAFTDSVSEFVTPIIENGDKTIYIKEAINTNKDVTRAVVDFHREIETNLKSNPIYTKPGKYTVSLKDAIQEIYNDNTSEPGEKIADMIQTMYTYGVDVQTIKGFTNVLSSNNVNVEIFDPSHMKFSQFFEVDKNGTIIGTTSEYNDFMRKQSNLLVNGVPVAFTTIIQDIKKDPQGSKYSELRDLEIKKADTLGIKITDTNSKQRYLSYDRQASFIDLEIPSSLNLTVNPRVQSNQYTKGSALEQATKSISRQGGLTGIGVITIDNYFCELYQQIKDGQTYSSQYEADSAFITELKDFLVDFGVITKQSANQFGAKELLRRLPLVSYNKKTGKYYIGKKVATDKKHINFAKKLLAKKEKYRSQNTAIVQDAANALVAMINELKNQGTKKIRVVCNITVHQAANELENILKAKGFQPGEVEFIDSRYLNKTLTQEVVTDFLAGSGVSWAKLTAQYNKYNRRLLNGLLGNGLMEDRADYVVSLGGFNPALATSLGDKVAITGLFKSYIDDDEQEAFTQEFEDKVKQGLVFPDDSTYIGMSSDDDTTLAVDTTDAFMSALGQYTANANKGIQDMTAAVEQLFGGSGNPLFDSLKKFTTSKITPVRDIIEQKEYWKTRINPHMSLQDVYLAVADIATPSQVNTYDPNDQKNASNFLTNYLYFCIKDGTGIYLGLQNVLLDANDNRYFTLDKFLKDRKISIIDNEVNVINDSDYLVLSALAEDMIDPIRLGGIDQGTGANKKHIPNPYHILKYEVADGKGGVDTHISFIASDTNPNVNTKDFLIEAAVAVEDWKQTKANNKKFNHIPYNEAVKLLSAQLNNVQINDITAATNFVKQHWQDMVKAHKIKKSDAIFADMAAEKAYEAEIRRRLKDTTIENKIAVAYELQDKLRALQDYVNNTYNSSDRAYQANKNALSFVQGCFTAHGLTQLGFVSAAERAYNSLNQATMSIFDKIDFNSKIIKAQTYIELYEKNSGNALSNLQKLILAIDNDTEYLKRPDIAEVKGRFDLAMQAIDEAAKRVKQSKKKKDYEAAIDKAVTDADKEQAWRDFFTNNNHGLVELQREATTLGKQLQTKYRQLGSESILKEPFTADSLTVNKLTSVNDFAQEYFGRYQELLNTKFKDPSVRDRADQLVQKIITQESLTLNASEAKEKAVQLNKAEGLRNEVLAYFTDVVEDTFKPGWLKEHHNKIALQDLTNDELVQVLMAMIQHNPSLLLLYKITVMENTGTIKIEARPETVLMALTAAGQTIDQFSSLTTKDAEDVFRILGISNTGDAGAAVAKAQRMLNNLGAPRLTVWRAFGNSFLDVADIHYTDKDPNSPFLEKDGLTDALGRFVFTVAIATNKEIVDVAKEGDDPRKGKVIPKRDLKALFGQEPQHDVSFYKFNKEKAADLKSLSDYMSVNVFSSIGRDIDVFQIGKAIDQKYKLAHGSEFRPIIYERDKNGNIVLDKKGKPKILSQLPKITREMLETLNNEAFTMSYDDFKMWNDVLAHPMEFLRGYGYKDERELNNMTELDRLSQVGLNNSLIHQVEAVRKMKERIDAWIVDHPNEDVKIYFDWEQIVSGRFQLKGALFNPQNNKVLRALLVAQGTNREWDLNDTKVVEKELFAVAQCFDCLDGGKRKYIRQMLNEITLEQANRLYQSLLTVSDKDFETMWSKWGLGIEERSLALQAAYHLIKRCEAKNKGSKVFKSNLMVEDDSTTSGYFLKMLLFPNRKIIRDYGIKVGVYDEETKKLAKAIYGVDYDELDIDQLKKMAFFQDVYRSQAITTDAILKEPNTMHSFLVDVDENGNETVKSIFKQGRKGINAGIIDSLAFNKDVNNPFNFDNFVSSLPHVGTKNGMPSVSKEFREMLKPITMVFSYGAGKNKIVGQLGETLYAQIYGELNDIVYCSKINSDRGVDILKQQVKDYVGKLTAEEIAALYPKAALFAYNLMGGNLVRGIDSRKLPKGIVLDNLVLRPENIDQPFATGLTNQQELYEALIRYGYFYSKAVKGVLVNEEFDDYFTHNKVQGKVVKYFSPEDIIVNISPKTDKAGNPISGQSNTTTFDMAIKNVFAATYGEAVYEGLRRDFGQFITINDAVNTMQTINTAIMKTEFNKELDAKLASINKKLIGMNENDDNWKTERAKAFSMLTKKDVENLYMDMITKGFFPTGPNAASILSYGKGKSGLSEADEYLYKEFGRDSNYLGGIQIAERDPVSTLFNGLELVFQIETSKKDSNVRTAGIGSYSLYGVFNYVTDSGLRPAVSTIHSTDAYVLSKTIIDAAKQGIFATPIHDATFISALDQDVIGNLYNKASLEVGQQFNVLTEYVKWFESILNAAGYTKDVAIADGKTVTATEYTQLRYLAQQGNKEAIKELTRLEANNYIDKNNNFLGTKLNAFGFNAVQLNGVASLLGQTEALKEASSSRIGSEITVADVLRRVREIRDLFDDPITGYRAKFYANNQTAFNLAGIEDHATIKGTGSINSNGDTILFSGPWFNPSNVPVGQAKILLNTADTTKAGILQLFDTLAIGEDAEYVSRLHNMLDQFLDVDTLQGWIVSQQYVRGNNAGLTSPSTKTISLYSQDPKFAATGYSQSNAEVYAHELIHALFDFAFNNQQNPKIAASILKLRVLREYVIKHNLITKDDFYNATGLENKLEEAEKRAGELYDYIFSEDEAHPDRGLKEFLSFVLTNKTMYEKLQDVKIKGQNKRSILGLIFDAVAKMFKTLFGKMQTFAAFSGIMDQLSGNLLQDGDTVFETAVKLCLDIKKANTTAETLLDKAAATGEVATNFVNSVRDAGNHLVNPLLKSFTNIPHLALKLGSGSKAEVAAKLLALAPFNSDVRKGLHSYLAMLGTELTGGYLNDLINDLKSSDDYTFDLARAGRMAQKIDGVEQGAYEILQRKLRNEFTSLTIDQENALPVFVRGNLQCWLDGDETHTIEWIKNLLVSPEYRDNMKTNLLKRNFPQEDKQDSAKVEARTKALSKLIDNLAKYEAAIMVNAKGTTFFSSNDNSRTMIKRSMKFIRKNIGYNPKDAEKFMENMSIKLDKLASLYYLDEMAKRDSNKLLLCYGLEDKGIAAYLGLHQHYVQTAAKTRSLTTTEAEREAGIVPGVKLYAGTTDIRFAPRSEKEIMEYNQYKMLDTDKMVTNANDNLLNFQGMKAKGEYALYVRRLTSPTRIDGSGISSNALKDTSLSLDSILSDTFDLTEEVNEQMNSELARSYREADQEDVKEAATNKYKQNSFHEAIKRYSDQIWQTMFTKNYSYDELENSILTSYYDGSRLRPYNYKDSVNLMNLDDNGIRLLSKMVSTQTVTPQAYTQNVALIAMLNAYFEENGVKYGFGKYRDKNSKLFFIDVKPQLIKKFGSSVSQILKEYPHLYVREDMIKEVLGVESWSITNWKRADKRNVVPPAFYKAAWYTENLLKLFGFKAKENVVIRTPDVAFGNVMSNFNIHLLTESNAPKVVKMYVNNTQALLNYMKANKRKLELEYKVQTKTITDTETKELARVKMSMQTSPIEPLIKEGMFTSIVEDLTTLTQEGMSQITEEIMNLPVIKKTSNGIKNIFKQLYMLKGTPVYEFMYHINQYSDFVARITEYQLQMERCPYKKELQPSLYEKYEKKVLNDLWDKFIDYRVPVNRVEQYLNDIGFINFAKYFRRIQRVLASQLINNPVGCLMQFARQCVLKPLGLETENIFSSNFITKNYDALVLGPEKAVYNTALPGLFHFFGWFKYNDNK